MMNFRTIEFVVARCDGVEISNMLLVRADVDDALVDPSLPPEEQQEAFLDLLQGGIQAWVRQTREGRELYEYATDDMNFGDLALIASESGQPPYLKYCVGIASLSLIGLELAEALTYDSRVCGNVDEDED
jgi:hypothetical protein